MQSTNNSAIEFTNVSLSIGNNTLINNISLSLSEKRIYGILGPNGAGKTTLLNLVIGLIEPTSGSIKVLGKNMQAKDNALRRQIGVVFQETALYEDLTVLENLLFFASLYAINNPKKRSYEVLEILGMSDRVHDRVHILSGGLKRRTAIARALLHNPKLLVVDEPTLGVDVETRHAIWEHLQFLRSSGHTILVSSNYLDEAQAICDTVSVLNKGSLLITDSPEALIARAGHSLDIECSRDSAEKISAALKNKDGIVRMEPTLSGLSIFLKGETIPDSIVNIVMKAASVNTFRFRPADLAEVFRALELNSSLTEDVPAHTGTNTGNTKIRKQVLITIMTILILAVIIFLEVYFSQPR